MQTKLRRNRIGTKAADLWSWEVEDIRKMTGPLAVQQYIQQLIRNDPSDVKKIVQCPSTVDINQWKYEQTRQIILQMNLLVTSLKQVCTQTSCPKMKGSQQTQYLCTVHKQASTCCSMQYMCHNLDNSTSILLNSKSFEVRNQITQTKSLQTIYRRLCRVFSHTYNYHKEVFEAFQKDMALCQRFVTFVIKYHIIDENTLGNLRNIYWNNHGSHK